MRRYAIGIHSERIYQSENEMASFESVRDTSSAAGNRSASPRAASSVPSDVTPGKSSETAGRSGREPRAREQEALKAWIREHEEMSLIGAFALGVFIGALMRS